MKEIICLELENKWYGNRVQGTDSLPEAPLGIQQPTKLGWD